ncbi:LIM domain only protein 7b isoform X2 [Astyanax mexicanus]|uniref:LIM domain only protein 7b isoform X2 n=1 Tax=Astyanax mexicanus TaxID=7994 RepID=UPI000BBDE0ED|nr:LIM domain only protein 7b isoform X2 [Astyanax mexicanus]
MEWREQSTLSCEEAFTEAQRWVEEVTRKRFGSSNFRSALENGVLLCDLLNKLKPGIIKRVNRLSTPIAGLDNVNVFLKACGKLGLNDAQLFHPGDLQDVSTRVTVRREETTRRLKNVLITIYWLGRKAQADSSYSGPQLNFKAFEGLLGVALSKALEESACPKPSARDSGYVENWYPEREEVFSNQQLSYRREDSVESVDSVESRTLSVASDCTLIAGSEGFGSDAEAEHCFRMSEGSRSETHAGPVREKTSISISLRRKQGGRYQEGGRSHVSQLPRSKSMSDLALESIPQESESGVAFDSSRSWQSQQREAGDQEQLEQIQLIQTRVKDSEARWQDDLNKWKSRRMTANLDLRRKKEEREQLELFTGRGGADGVRTAVLTGVQEESDQCVLQFPPHSQSQATRPLDPSCAQEPSARHLPPSQPPPLPAALKENPQLASLASDQPFPASEAESPLTPSCSMPGALDSTLMDPLPTPGGLSKNGACSLSDDANGGDSLVTEHSQVSTSVFFSPPESTSTGPERSRQDAAPIQRAKSLEGIFSGGARMSATLPRGFRRSEGGSRLSTGVTPRPFGSKTSKVSSLPRFCSMDDSHTSLIKGQRERPQLPASFTCPQQEGQNDSIKPNGSLLKSENEEGVREEEEKNHSAPRVHSFMSASMVATSLKQRSVSESEQTKVAHADMRVSLNQKPGGRRDFGFQAHWDSTGARIKSVQPGSPAQLCHLQAGDEIVAVGGQRVAEMSYEQWKANMDAALKEGSLLMDIRRHGQNGHPEHCVTVSSSSTSPVEKVTEVKVNGHAGNGLPAKAVNRNFRDVPAAQKNNGSSGSTVDSWVYLCGGSESAISDLQVPSISASSSRWSWDTEEERRRQEKWQMEQERLLQEKYRRDQERLEEEWRRAQLAAAGEEYCGPERPLSMSNGNTIQYTQPHFQYQPASSTLTSQCATDAAPLQSRQVTMQISPDHQTKEEWGSSTKTSQWPRESCGFAKLTSTDRQKSKSTPALDSSHKQDSRVSVKRRGRPSQAEKDRQQILEEMRKRTPLHTDSSWIRQRSTCTIYKEPINVAPMRRYESLDNLHSSSNSLSRQFSTMSNPARPHSALDNITPYRGYSGRCSLGPGAAIFSNTSKQSSWSRPSSTSSTPPITPGAEDMRPSSQQHTGLVSGRRLCSRCEQPLGKGAAMVIDTLDLCFHIGCFKCVSCRSDLGRGSQSRAQVRIRHRQLFCDTCYSRLRVRPGIPK